ncbi:MAG: hypothetical protein ABFR47_01570 [Verrucomicrobiota bacterium]
MKRRSFMAAVLLGAILPGVRAETYESGKIIKEVQCFRDRSYSYMLYLPSGYTPDRAVKWPVVFAMDSKGGTEEDIKRYIEGAEKNNWIVALSIQSKALSSESAKAVAAMVGDVFARFAVDKERCYAAGMAGGARMAFWLAGKRRDNIIGIIPCGAGDVLHEYHGRALAYGLCGARSFSRWDMAITFNERIRSRGYLRFFPGEGLRADEELVFDAITWLNGKYLSKKGSPGEIEQFSKMIYDEILEKYDADPFSAYETATILSWIPKTPPLADNVKAMADKLEEGENIQLYIQGLKDMDGFVERHFNTKAGDCINNRLTRWQKEDADLLLAKYADTPLAPVIADFGKPSDKFERKAGTR